MARLAILLAVLWLCHPAWSAAPRGPPLVLLTKPSLFAFLGRDDWWQQLQARVVAPLGGAQALPPAPDVPRLERFPPLETLEGQADFKWARKELQCQLTFLTLVAGALADAYPQLVDPARPTRPSPVRNWQQLYSIPEMGEDLEKNLLRIIGALHRNQTIAALELSTHAAMVYGWKLEGAHLTALTDLAELSALSRASASSGSSGSVSSSGGSGAGGRGGGSGDVSTSGGPGGTAGGGGSSGGGPYALCWDEVAVMNVMSDPDSWAEDSTLAAIMHFGALSPNWQSRLHMFFNSSREHVQLEATVGNVELAAVAAGSLGSGAAGLAPHSESHTTIEWVLPGDSFQDRMTVPSEEEQEVFESSAFVAAGFAWYAQILTDDFRNVSLAIRMWEAHASPALFQITFSAVRQPTSGPVGPAGSGAGAGGSGWETSWLCEWPTSFGALHTCMHPSSMPLWKMLSGGTMPGYLVDGELLLRVTVQALPAFDSCGAAGSSSSSSAGVASSAAAPAGPAAAAAAGAAQAAGTCSAVVPKGPLGGPPRLLSTRALRWSQLRADPRMWHTLGFPSKRLPGSSAAAADRQMQAAKAARFAAAPWLEEHMRAAAAELMSLDAKAWALPQWSSELPGLAGRVAGAMHSVQLFFASLLLVAPLAAPLVHAGWQAYRRRHARHKLASRIRQQAQQTREESAAEPVSPPQAAPKQQKHAHPSGRKQKKPGQQQQQQHGGRQRRQQAVKQPAPALVGPSPARSRAAPTPTESCGSSGVVVRGGSPQESAEESGRSRRSRSSSSSSRTSSGSSLLELQSGSTRHPAPPSPLRGPSPLPAEQQQARKQQHPSKQLPAEQQQAQTRQQASEEKQPDLQHVQHGQQEQQEQQWAQPQPQPQLQRQPVREEELPPREPHSCQAVVAAAAQSLPESPLAPPQISDSASPPLEASPPLSEQEAQGAEGALQQLPRADTVLSTPAPVPPVPKRQAPARPLTLALAAAVPPPPPLAHSLRPDAAALPLPPPPPPPTPRRQPAAVVQPPPPAPGSSQRQLSSPAQQREAPPPPPAQPAVPLPQQQQPPQPEVLPQPRLASLSAGPSLAAPGPSSGTAVEASRKQQTSMDRAPLFLSQAQQRPSSSASWQSLAGQQRQKLQQAVPAEPASVPSHAATINSAAGSADAAALAAEESPAANPFVAEAAAPASPSAAALAAAQALAALVASQAATGPAVQAWAPPTPPRRRLAAESLRGPPSTPSAAAAASAAAAPAVAVGTAAGTAAALRGRYRPLLLQPTSLFSAQLPTTAPVSAVPAAAAAAPPPADRLSASSFAAASTDLSSRAAPPPAQALPSLRDAAFAMLPPVTAAAATPAVPASPSAPPAVPLLLPAPTAAPLPASGAGSPLPADEGQEDVCVVCWEERRRSVLVPCGHMALCRCCAHNLMQLSQPLCPICRQDVAFAQEVFTP